MPITIDKFLGTVREKDGATLPEIDETPTEGSSNLITSGAVYAALGNIETTLGDVEATLDAIIGGA